MIERKDEEIAMLVQQGDVESFGLLVEHYEQKIKRYARKFLFDTEDSQDMVQEVFLKAYINIQSFDPQRRFSPWLYRIAHNEFINAIKKKGKVSIFSFDSDAILPHVPQLEAPETADSAAEHQELRKMLDHSLDKLDAKYRETLVLYYYEDLDYQEIAEILEIPVSTVGVRLRRGRLMLKEIIQKPEYLKI